MFDVIGSVGVRSTTSALSSGGGDSDGGGSVMSEVSVASSAINKDLEITIDAFDNIVNESSGDDLGQYFPCIY
jgi:hypothetical protein